MYTQALIRDSIWSFSSWALLKIWVHLALQSPPAQCETAHRGRRVYKRRKWIFIDWYTDSLYGKSTPHKAVFTLEEHWISVVSHPPLCTLFSSVPFLIWLMRAPIILNFRAFSINPHVVYRVPPKASTLNVSTEPELHRPEKNQRDVNYIWPRSTGTIKQTPGLRWSLPCVKVSHVLCLHYTAGFEIVLQCGVCPGSLFVFDVFIHHTRSNDF